MKHIEGSFRGIGNLELFRQAWIPEVKPKAAVIIIHGVLEHSGCHERMANTFVSRGFAVYSYDQRGHGRSPGQMVHIDRFSEYRSDLAIFLLLVKKEQPDLPVFLYGHSMGGLVCLDFIEHDPNGLNGAVISAASLEPSGFANPGLILLAKVMSGIWPRFSANPGLKTEDVFADPAARARSAADPLIRKTVSARWGTENLKTIDEVKKNVSEIHTPILILHGDADRCNNIRGSIKFFESVPYPDKELKLYPGVYHAMHSDGGNEVILEDAGEWITRHG